MPVVPKTVTAYEKIADLQVGPDSKHIHSRTADASAGSSASLGDAFELQFALLFVTDDGERDG